MGGLRITGKSGIEVEAVIDDTEAVADELEAGGWIGQPDREPDAGLGGAGGRRRGKTRFRNLVYFPTFRTTQFKGGEDLFRNLVF